MTHPSIALVGAYGSPYSRKMHALLRYRRIPFRWIVRGSRWDVDVPAVPVDLIPVLVLPGATPGAAPTAMIDSTFQIKQLEQRQPGRGVVPADPAMAFLDFLLEDYADEWLTKAMFHYRWAFAADADHAAAILPRWNRIERDEDAVAAMSRMFAGRQIGRLSVVGSNETTGAVIEESYRRLLRLLDRHLRIRPFVMGGRPGTADFAIYGQLSQLVQFDPTSAAVAFAESSRVVAWCQLMEDLSGIEVEDADWLGREAAGDTLRELLAEAGRVYAPFLLANAGALDRGAAQVDCEIDGRRWVQKPFPYQRKCLGWLREAHAELAPSDREWVDRLLAGTGCDGLFAVAANAR